MISRLYRFLQVQLGRSWWLWVCLFLIGAVTNFGTAVIRLRTLLPSPQPVDFAAYYVGSWAMRLGASPYYWPAEMLRSVAAGQHMTVTPAPPVSTPPWVWLTQGLTVFSFPVAAWIWLLVQVAAIVWCTSAMVRVAGHPGWRATLVVCPFTITFGSTFLNLTTGQNGLFVLLGVVLLARHLGKPRTRPLAAVVGWVVAVAAKIYPLLWLAAWLFLKKRLALAMALTVTAVFAVILLAEPAANKDYWLRFLPGNAESYENAESYGGGVRVDDQSLDARVALLGRTSKLGFSGKDVETRHERVWRPPREIPWGVVHLITAVGLLGLGAGVVRVWVRADAARYGEGLFYLVVLYGLLPIPHMERYNHVAILPAMAWLWGQERRYRSLTVVAYCLVGLSRLNHLWALIFAWPLGPLATGTCLYAVLILGGGIAHRVLSGSSRTLEPGVTAIPAS